MTTTCNDARLPIQKSFPLKRHWATLAAPLFFSAVTAAADVQVQSVGRYETHLQSLLILDPPPNNNGSRHRGSAAVVLDRFTGAFRVCEVHIGWPPPLPPGEDGTRRCYTTPPLATSTDIVRFEILTPHIGFSNSDPNPNQQNINLFVTDNATGGVTRMIVVGQRDASNFLVWSQRRELTPQF